MVRLVIETFLAMCTKLFFVPDKIHFSNSTQEYRECDKYITMVLHLIDNFKAISQQDNCTKRFSGHRSNYQQPFPCFWIAPKSLKTGSCQQWFFFGIKESGCLIVDGRVFSLLKSQVYRSFYYLFSSVL